MKMKEYLKKSGYRSEWFAKQIPCSPSYLSIIACGKAKPSPIIIKRIFDLTNGEVKEKDLEVSQVTDTPKNQ